MSMSDTIKAQREQLAQLALEKPELLQELIDRLNGSSRRHRQNAAATLAAVAALDSKALLPCQDVLIAALENSEAQTRWECIDALSRLLPEGLTVDDDLLDDVESALFDEESGLLRLAAMRFVCRYAVVAENGYATAWPMIDEAIQCYHGDPEFMDMLVAVAEMSEHELPEAIAHELASRMEFDAGHSRGMLKKRAQQILDNLNK